MKFRTKPFPHQLEEWNEHRETPARGLLWEQGTGKTWEALNTAAWLAQKGLVDAMLVIAPNGVHENWVADEIPEHWSGPRIHPFVWSSRKARTKRHEEAARRAVEAPFPFVAMSYDAFMTRLGRRYAEGFLHKRKVFYVLDESHRVKTPGAKRTQGVVASGRRATYKRILSGTPITNSPFEIYTQVRFLDEFFWKDRGFASYEAFKNYFGVWETVERRDGHRFPNIVCFKNLDHLARLVAEVGSRVTKDEALDLPPKVYAKRYFELSSTQARLYKQLRDECMAILDSGEVVTTPRQITMLLRLQQITCGYLPSDDCQNLNVLDDNPRLDLLVDTLEDVTGQAVVWARFQQDVSQICDALSRRAVRYDGQVAHKDRTRNQDAFKGGEVQFFVGNPEAGGEGLNLQTAADMVYYSNSFKPGPRIQSEDRIHRIHQDRTCRYVDLLARGTVDVQIVAALRRKRSVAAEVTGDKLREWL